MSNPNDTTAQLYDIISAPVKGPDITDEEIALISSLVLPGSSILDIGAGTGRHLVPLVELGYKVTGIDSSEKMLNELRTKLRIKNDELQIESHVINANILTDNSKLETYNLVILMWNAFNEIALTLEGAQHLLGVLSRITASGGKVLINSDDPELEDMKSKDFELNYSKDNIDYKMKWKVISYDEESNTSTSEEIVSFMDNDKLVEHKTQITQRWWSEDEYRKLAEQNGFKFERMKLKRNSEMYLVLNKVSSA
ncbi:MAG: class I SAM-dependent methyltransferase [Candidatus Dojkabacteria bacterium]